MHIIGSLLNTCRLATYIVLAMQSSKHNDIGITFINLDFINCFIGSQLYLLNAQLSVLYQTACTDTHTHTHTDNVHTYKACTHTIIVLQLQGLLTTTINWLCGSKRVHSSYEANRSIMNSQELLIATDVTNIFLFHTFMGWHTLFTCSCLFLSFNDTACKPVNICDIKLHSDDVMMMYIMMMQLNVGLFSVAMCLYV